MASIAGLPEEVKENSEVVKELEERIESTVDWLYALKGRLRNLRGNRKYELKGQERDVIIWFRRDVGREIEAVFRDLGAEFPTEVLIRL